MLLLKGNKEEQDWKQEKAQHEMKEEEAEIAASRKTEEAAEGQLEGLSDHLARGRIVDEMLNPSKQEACQHTRTVPPNCYR